MRDVLTPLFVLLFLVAGAMLLDNGFSKSDLSQTAKILGGAACVAIALIGACGGLKNWWKWRKILREYGEE